MSGSIRFLALILLALPAIAIGFVVQRVLVGTSPASFLARLGAGLLSLMSTCVALYGFLRLLGWASLRGVRFQVIPDSHLPNDITLSRLPPEQFSRYVKLVRENSREIVRGIEQTVREHSGGKCRTETPDEVDDYDVPQIIGTALKEFSGAVAINGKELFVEVVHINEGHVWSISGVFDNDGSCDALLDAAKREPISLNSTLSEFNRSLRDLERHDLKYEIRKRGRTAVMSVAIHKV